MSASLLSPNLGVSVLERTSSSETSDMTYSKLEEQLSEVHSRRSKAVNHAQVKLILGEKKKSGPSAFETNLFLAMRIGFGVLLAGLVQMKTPDSSGYVLIPSRYYLGGLTYAAIMVIVSAGKNLGQSMKTTLQAFVGVFIALCFNVILFSVVSLPSNDGNLVQVFRTLDTDTYRVNQQAVMIFAPIIVLFTAVLLVLPIDLSIKKFAIGMNLYFALTVINPNNPSDPTELKAEDGEKYDYENIMFNFLIYFLIGVGGSIVSIFTMCFPSPLLALNLLLDEVAACQAQIQLLFNLLIDTYAVQTKTLDELEFLSLKLDRNFQTITTRVEKMQRLLQDVWWEENFGGVTCFRPFKRNLVIKYVELMEGLISDLKSIRVALDRKNESELHTQYMHSLQEPIYRMQSHSLTMLDQIAQDVLMFHEELHLTSKENLQKEMTSILTTYRRTQIQLLQQQKTKQTHDDQSINNEIDDFSLSIFLFSLVSFCQTLTTFATAYSTFQAPESSTSALKYLNKTKQTLEHVKNIERDEMLSTIKLTLAIFIAVLPSVYFFSFSSTAPSVIAIIMSKSIGGTFTSIANRSIGIAAGSIIPAIFKSFICWVCLPSLQSLLNNLFVWVWTTLCMYVYFSGHMLSGGGMVAAIVSVGVSLVDCSRSCRQPNASSSAFSTLVQTAMGVLIYLLVEVIMCPRSAIGNLRRAKQSTLSEMKTATLELYQRHLCLSTEKTLPPEAMHDTLVVSLPKQLEIQATLLNEAQVEPVLWRPTIEFYKYQKVRQTMIKMTRDLLVMYKLLEWQHTRAPEERQNRVKYQYDSNHVLEEIVANFDTASELFDKHNMKLDADQKALYLQMKEAFRAADEDKSGVIDAGEVRKMIHTILAHDHRVKEEALEEIVQEFLTLVDQDQTGTVSWSEFVNAMEGGMKFGIAEFSTSNLRQSQRQSQLWQSYDALSIQSFMLDDNAEQLLHHYNQWLLQHATRDEYQVDDALVMSCFIGSLQGLIKGVIQLQQLIAST